jgi:hypothetical protein
MEREVLYKQKGTDVVLSLLPGEVTPWHWVNKELAHEMSIKLAGESYEWYCHTITEILIEYIGHVAF